jgi:hypothetical protein
MAKNYTKDQMWILFERLPEELKDAIFAVKTSDEINDACAKNNVEKEKIPAIAKITGNVMLGVLPIDEFQIALEKEIGLKPDIAKNVFQRINRFIFFPVRNELNELYKITSTKKDSSDQGDVEKKSFSLKSDTYREPLL